MCHGISRARQARQVAASRGTTDHSVPHSAPNNCRIANIFLVTFRGAGYTELRGQAGTATCVMHQPVGYHPRGVSGLQAGPKRASHITGTCGEDSPCSSCEDPTRECLNPPLPPCLRHIHSLPGVPPRLLPPLWFILRTLRVA